MKPTMLSDVDNHRHEGAERLNVRGQDWNDADNLISVGVVAARLGLCTENVRLMTKAGKLPSVKIGRRRLYRSGDVKAFVEALKELMGSLQ